MLKAFHALVKLPASKVFYQAIQIFFPFSEDVVLENDNPRTDADCQWIFFLGSFLSLMLIMLIIFFSL